jgi:hypothetical protein
MYIYMYTDGPVILSRNLREPDWFLRHPQDERALTGMLQCHGHMVHHRIHPMN